MSLDLVAYFTKRPPAISSKGSSGIWQMNIDTAQRVEPDDIDTSLKPYLKRCRWQANVTLEGESTPQALSCLEDLKAELIGQHGAHIYDPQTDTVTASTGTQIVLNWATGSDNEKPFELNIYFENADLIDKARISALLDIIQDLLPEALPHRYGHFEPPEWRWSDGGKAAYLDRWDRKDPPFTMGKTPVQYVFSSFDLPSRGGVPCFVAGLITFVFRPRLAEQPRKISAVLRLAESFAVELDAFYASLIHGHEQPGPFWTGLHPGEHLQIILGGRLLANSFLKHWKEFDAVSRPLGANHRVATVEGGSAPVAPPKPLCFAVAPNHPALISQGGPAEVPTGEYAPVFPFPKHNPYDAD